MFKASHNTTLPASLLKTGGLATSMWDPVLNPSIPLPIVAPPPNKACI